MKLIKPTQCEHCGRPILLVDDTAYVADSLAPIRELPLVIAIHGCVAPDHGIPAPSGEAIYLDDPEPAVGLIAQIST